VPSRLTRRARLPLLERCSRAGHYQYRGLRRRASGSKARGLALTLPSMDPSIKVLPVELPGARKTMRIVSLKDRSLSPLAEVFINRTRALTVADHRNRLFVLGGLYTVLEHIHD
jgi:hypothetical protein